MNNYKLFCALNYIGDDLICEAAEYRSSKKAQIAYIRKCTTAAACVAAIAGAAYCLNNNSRLDRVAPSVDTRASNSAEISDIIPLVDNAENSHTVSNDNTSPRLSSLTLEEWLRNPDVIWGGEEVKGDIVSDPIPLGTVKISPRLSDLMEEGEDSDVFAVMVDFSPCINRVEMDNWEYNGDTLSSLRDELDKLFTDTGKSYTYVDGIDGTEHTGTHRSSDPEDSDKIANLRARIETIRSAYYDMKAREFKDSFERNGLGIYRTDKGRFAAEHYFYTFASRSDLEDFECKGSEAFVFYSAQALK